MQRSWLGCIIALVVLIGFSFADDAIWGYVSYGGEWITDYIIYARCTDDDPPHQVESEVTTSGYWVTYDGDGDEIIYVPHTGNWKVKAYKPEVGISGWCPAHYLGQQGSNHYYENHYLIPLPKK